MELIELQENSLLKSKFEDAEQWRRYTTRGRRRHQARGRRRSPMPSAATDAELCDFYKKYFEEDHFPQLRKFARFYKCEKFFLMMKVNTSKHRTSLTDDNLENSLRFGISGINPTSMN
ncbi:hypothetical protein EVAR_13275_1 [Eumeta japonica]|uniref:Uncharacterized protein n=1 Tax=Eumeta variegata TaxID=151549 RepID=A0A4C1YQR7_EUMVA|nr:hypothetical protein EVAR_13275_1 [Eumeta japonica]